MIGSTLLGSHESGTELLQPNGPALAFTGRPPDATGSKTDSTDLVIIRTPRHARSEAARRHRIRRRRCVCALLWFVTMLAGTAAAVLLYEIISAEEHILVLGNRKDVLEKVLLQRTSVEIASTTKQVMIVNSTASTVSTASTNSIFIPYTGTVPPLEKDIDYEAYDDLINQHHSPSKRKNLADVASDQMNAAKVLSKSSQSHHIGLHAKEISSNRRHGRDVSVGHKRTHVGTRRVNKVSTGGRFPRDLSSQPAHNIVGFFGIESSVKSGSEVETKTFAESITGSPDGKTSHRRPARRVSGTSAERTTVNGNGPKKQNQLTVKATEIKDESPDMESAASSLKYSRRQGYFSSVGQSTELPRKFSPTAKTNSANISDLQDYLIGDGFTISTGETKDFEPLSSDDLQAENFFFPGSDDNSTPPSTLEFGMNPAENKLIESGLHYTSLFTVRIPRGSTRSMEAVSGLRSYPTPDWSSVNHSTEKDDEVKPLDSTFSSEFSSTPSLLQNDNGKATTLSKPHSHSEPHVSGTTNLKSTASTIYLFSRDSGDNETGDGKPMGAFQDTTRGGSTQMPELSNREQSTPLSSSSQSASGETTIEQPGRGELTPTSERTLIAIQSDVTSEGVSTRMNDGSTSTFTIFDSQAGVTLSTTGKHFDQESTFNQQHTTTEMLNGTEEAVTDRSTMEDPSKSKSLTGRETTVTAALITKGKPTTTPELSALSSKQPSRGSTTPTSEQPGMATGAAISLSGSTRAENGFRQASAPSDQRTALTTTATGANHEHVSTLGPEQTTSEQQGEAEGAVADSSAGEGEDRERSTSSTSVRATRGETSETTKKTVGFESLPNSPTSGHVRTLPPQQPAGGHTTRPHEHSARPEATTLHLAQVRSTGTSGPTVGRNESTHKVSTRRQQAATTKQWKPTASEQLVRAATGLSTTEAAVSKLATSTGVTSGAEPGSDKTSSETQEPVTTAQHTKAVTTKATTMMTSASTTSRITRALKPCFKTWIHWEGSCYKPFPWPVSWNFARRSCLIREANLASVHSSRENDFLVGRFGPDCSSGRCRAVTGLHIGLTDAAREGRFVWTDGSAVDFQNWSDDQPSNSPPPYGDRHGEDCAELRVVFDFGRWNDIGCDNVRRPFICKAPAYEHIRRMARRRRLKGA